ncbi:putative ABC transport system ATP-binding protein [Paenibacillus cellulosilyticus]|uniref:Putative ABC transport system ATP-binding protein n=1 Tax=Paenibacillus cellulosilyticus TaxID=375489 RepID=A0A2V2YUZ7_9BACL|nr:ABC transporter ATP-binding protein [Paenibacillus cellulosilyticus]PWW03280.1 putative ABC transport system ATP-binding protein [Paenibacillus cellulosilyticus]QKS43758.1 ABC transporter ATP-binding protein [Paenibacillus cellulosilyticus]
MQNVWLKTEKLCKTFSSGGLQQHVLKNLDIRLMKGDFTVIMGSSGSGKSTLLYALSGMDKPTLGTIHFGDSEISKLNNDKLAIFRRNNCGFVFQQIHLLDNMSVLDNVLASGLLISRNKKETAARAKQLLTEVGLTEETWRKFPSQLSGGEAQRAGIVRALINKPAILFADEPTGALNSAASDSVLDVLTKMNQTGQSIVMVTHDIKTAMRGNRILFLRDGVIRGDMSLGPYQKGHSAERQEQLQDFLSDMRW